MKVILKKKPLAINPSLISTRDIIALDNGSSIILTEPVKTEINIKYDAKGYPDINALELGVQYDHRVTWLHFDLSELIWHLNEEKGYTDLTKYNYYTFKLLFSRTNEEGIIETSSWEFDGIDFEIPYGITKNSGTYRMVLVIEEYQDDDMPGNIHEDTIEKIERFVAAEVKAQVVRSTVYSPEYDITINPTTTDQKASLIKPTIDATLTDIGIFETTETELGQQFDNFIRYIKFNPQNLTAHLNDFTIIAAFKKEDKFYYSLFEQTKPDDVLDDYSDTNPIIAWIPTEVYQSAGKWKIAIIAFAGKIEEMNNSLTCDNGDYYFYVSHEYSMKVVKNKLTYEDVTKDPTLSITSNLLTSQGDLIITKDGLLYQQIVGGKDDD